jgi:hypothetical protein
MNPFDDPDFGVFRGMPQSSFAHGARLETFRQALLAGEAAMTAERLLEVVEDLDTSPQFCAPELMRFENCAAPWIEVADATWPGLACDLALAYPDLDEDVWYRFELFTLELARAFPSEAQGAFGALRTSPNTPPELYPFCDEVLEAAGKYPSTG